MSELPLQAMFNEFVVSKGGELMEEMLPNNDGRKRADYLFRSPLTVAELKCLERDINLPAYNRKLLGLARDWSRRGLIRVYGRAQIDLRKLPKPCQDEWMRLLEAPIQKHILSDANKQIREAKESLGLPDAKGAILIANEGHLFSTPADLLTYTARILKKKKPDGQALYSSIDHIVLFSTNIKMSSPEFPQGIAGWLNTRRDSQADPTWTNFLNELGESWLRFCAEKMGHTYTRRRLGIEQIKAMRFIPPAAD